MVASAALVGLLAVHREALRRVVMGTVDPRPLGLFRIALGLCLLAYAVEIAPLSTYLFSDEGLLPSAAVPQLYGRGALAGYGDGVREAAGFASAEAVLRHGAHGRWSLLFFWDHPAFVHGVLAAFVLASVGMVVGWHARACTLLAWLLLTGLLRRGDAHWGGEQVMLGLLFPLLFARSGAAFSLDARRRHRALERAGELDRRPGPEGGRGAAPSNAHPRGLAALYPRVPAWPQVMIVGQLALCYAVNGWTKSGPTWLTGDTLRLSLHLDEYARVDWHALTVALGPWPFRLATWGVLWWERLFPLVLVGLWIRATATAGAPPPSSRARWASRLCALILAGALVAMTIPPDALGRSPAISRARAPALQVAALLIALAPWAWSRARPWVSRLTAPVPWLAFGLMFHLVSVVMLELGTFVMATVAAYLLCGLGPAAVAAVQRLTHALARRGVPLPEHLRRPEPVGAEDPALPHLHRDTASLPGWALAAAGGLVLAGAGLTLRHPAAATGWWHGAWLLAAAGLMGLAIRRARGRTRAPDPPRPWAHGPAGRLAAGGVLAYHLVALSVWQTPPWRTLPWRHHAREMVNPWMELSFTRQLWSMFAPNGPRRNVSVRTTVVDADGVLHDLRTELQHPENLRRPYLRPDRWRKIHEGLRGNRGTLAPWHARYVCRRWALTHGGLAPRTVRLERVRAPFPPFRPLDPAAWFWAHADVDPIVEVDCATEPFAQLSAEVRARHGLPPMPPSTRHYAWPGSPARPPPLEPLWVGLALLLGLGWGAWAWSERRDDDQKRSVTPSEA